MDVAQPHSSSDMFLLLLSLGSHSLAIWGVDVTLCGVHYHYMPVLLWLVKNVFFPCCLIHCKKEVNHSWCFFSPGFISVCCQPSHGSMILSCFFCFVRDSKKKKKKKVLQSIWRVDISLDIFIPWQRFISVCNHNFIFTDSNPLRSGVFSPQCFQGLMVDFRLSKVYT